VQPTPKPAQPRKLHNINEVLDPSNKDSPSHLVIILRGLPGSGKTEVAKSLKEKESSLRGRATRLLSLDSYFLIDDDDSDEEGYDEDMEDSYRQSMLKSFVKILGDGFFPMIVIEGVNNKVSHIERFWQEAKKRGFEVYVADLHAGVGTCVARNKHKFKKEEIQRLMQCWEDVPLHYNLLDVTSCTHEDNIEEIEMEDEAKPPELPESTLVPETEDSANNQEVCRFIASCAVWC
jgi:YLP motif-containing protein 1